MKIVAGGSAEASFLARSMHGPGAVQSSLPPTKSVSGAASA
jgi:hypothetical protein